jgi:hypothetical protein
VCTFAPLHPHLRVRDVSRHGTAKWIPTATGYIARYASAWDAVNGRFMSGTPVTNGTFLPTNGHTCVAPGPTNPCDHFGVSTYYSQPTQALYFWLLADPVNPGQLIRCPKALGIPHPYVYIGAAGFVQQNIQLPQWQPAPAGCAACTTGCCGNCVQTATHVDHCGGCGQQCQADQICVNGECGYATLPPTNAPTNTPTAAPTIFCANGTTACGGQCVDLQTNINHCGLCFNPCRFGTGKTCSAGQCTVVLGDATWVRVFKTEVDVAPALEDLVTGNPVVPTESQTETGWKLLQFNPNKNGADTLNSGGVKSGSSKAVVRKWEFYKYSGAYDPVDHTALCADGGLCAAPLDGELGAYIGSQMASVNFADVPTFAPTDAPTPVPDVPTAQPTTAAPTVQAAPTRAPTTKNSGGVNGNGKGA